jgi:hypothetical protein
MFSTFGWLMHIFLGSSTFFIFPTASCVPVMHCCSHFAVAHGLLHFVFLLHIAAFILLLRMDFYVSIILLRCPDFGLASVMLR